MPISPAKVQLPPEAGPARTAVWGEGDSLTTEIEETDLLFIDTHHTGERFAAELQKHAPKVRRFIIRHDTKIYGQQGSDGKDGLLIAAREFIAKNPEWFIAWHTDEQYGLTVLGRQEQDRPAKPLRLWPRGFGPGTEFKSIMQDFGIQMPNNCGCRSTMLAMDELGPAGCRERLDELVKGIEERAKEWGWEGKIEQAMTAATKDTPERPSTFRLIWNGIFGKSHVAVDMVREDWSLLWNPVEAVKRPIPVLIKVAIARAEKKEGKAQ